MGQDEIILALQELGGRATQPEIRRVLPKVAPRAAASRHAVYCYLGRLERRGDVRRLGGGPLLRWELVAE